MATREYWIQIENKLWDLAPNGINRMTGDTGSFHKREVVETEYDIDDRGNPVDTGVRRREMFRPVEVLILRRYRAPDPALEIDAWTVPLDRKVNPWDLNEPDPAETGGTIPGATLECEIGDDLVVHFRNMDQRHKPNGRPLNYKLRTHSLHPHGISFSARYDGAFPISPHDPEQPIPPSERRYFRRFGNRFFLDEQNRFLKRSDLVPPGATFIYRWDTRGWATTAGVWLYHDHSVADHHNVLHGAIGMLVIHDPADARDVNVNPDDGDDSQFPNGDPNGAIVVHGRYVDPPERAQCLQLYHELPSAGMCINGRQFLGNSPTFVAGPQTLIRFGLGAMNNEAFHTFHLHGHRWRTGIGRGDGTADTRIFGPAETFSFSVQEGTDEGPPPDESKGEWHMHCHVLHHMMSGMMGSLLLAEGGDEARPLPLQQPLGLPHEMPTQTVGPLGPRRVDVSELAGQVSTDSGDCSITAGGISALLDESISVVSVMDQFMPRDVEVRQASVVRFEFAQAGHTVTTDKVTPEGAIDPIEVNNGRGPNHSMPAGSRASVVLNGPLGAVLEYYCGIHGRPMSGTIRIVD